MLHTTRIGNGIITFTLNDDTKGVESIELNAGEFGLEIHVSHGTESVQLYTHRNSRVMHYFPEGYPSLEQLSVNMFMVI